MSTASDVRCCPVVFGRMGQLLKSALSDLPRNQSTCLRLIAESGATGITYRQLSALTRAQVGMPRSSLSDSVSRLVAPREYLGGLSFVQMCSPLRVFVVSDWLISGVED